MSFQILDPNHNNSIKNYIHIGTIEHINDFFFIYRHDASKDFSQKCLEMIQYTKPTDLVRFLQDKIPEINILGEYLVGYFSRNQKHYLFIQKFGKSDRSLIEQKEWVYGNFPTEIIYNDPENELITHKNQIIQSITII